MSVSGWVLTAGSVWPGACSLDDIDFFSRRDNRLDELPVRVLIPLLKQLGDRSSSIRGFVVGAFEIERPDRIVIWPDREDAREARQRRAPRVLQRGRLDRSQHLAHARAQAERLGSHAVWHRWMRRGADENHL